MPSKTMKQLTRAVPRGIHLLAGFDDDRAAGDKTIAFELLDVMALCNANRVDIRALGIVCDGVTTGQEAALEAIFAQAIANNSLLIGPVGPGPKLRRTIDGRGVNCDFRGMVWQVGDYAPSSTPNGFQPFYTGGNTGSQAGIVTRDITLPDGTTTRYGVAILGSGNTDNGIWRAQHWGMIRGDGRSGVDARPSTAIGVLFENDDSSLSRYSVQGSYIGWAAAIGGNQEKHVIEVDAYQSTGIMYNLPGSGADTIRLVLSGNDIRHIYGEAEGVSTSVITKLLVEATLAIPGGGWAFWGASGKSTAIEAGSRVRALNGGGFYFGKADGVGVDEVDINLSVIHATYATVLLFDEGRHLKGDVRIHDGASTDWTVRINSVFDCGLKLTIDDGTVCIGDKARNLRPIDVDFTNWTVVAGNTAPIGSSGARTSGTAAWPTDRTALYVDFAEGGSVTLDAVKGRTVIGADVIASETGRFRAALPRTASRYANQNNSQAGAEIVDRGTGAALA